MIWRAAPFIVGALALAAVWGHGYQTGQARQEALYAAAQARAEAAMREVRQQVAIAEAARLGAVRQLEELQDELAQQAADDPDADRRALGVDSLRRLNRIGAD